MLHLWPSNQWIVLRGNGTSLFQCDIVSLYWFGRCWGDFFGLLRNKLDMHFFLEILKGGGIKSPHINKMFFIFSDTKHKLDRWYKSFPASKLVWLDIYFHLLWKWVSVCLHGWPLDTFPVILRSLPFLEQTGKLNLPGIIIMRVPSASNPWFQHQASLSISSPQHYFASEA